MAENMFTVPDDYVRVTRCKDCLHSAPWKNQLGFEGFKCNLLCIDIDPYDYCNFSKRRINHEQ